MRVLVFIQNEAGSHTKHYHDETTLEWKRSAQVSRAYPFAYGFVMGTEAADGANVDCFVLTTRPLATGQLLECDVIGLMEQFEHGQPDHNVLARLPGEDMDVSPQTQSRLADFVMHVFDHMPDKGMRVGRYLGAADADAHMSAHRVAHARVWERALRYGIRGDAAGREILYRHILPDDDVDAITALLHEAYRPLADAGMRFMASHQDAAFTRHRMARGETIVAIEGGRSAGVITLAPAAATQGSPFYDRPDVASFGQFAVHPSLQRMGIGTRLMELVEARAAEDGAVYIALDTSERAADLIALYQARGYQFVEHCQWNETNYRSVVLAKRLDHA